jgi:hypothetical protein
VRHDSHTKNQSGEVAALVFNCFPSCATERYQRFVFRISVLKRLIKPAVHLLDCGFCWNAKGPFSTSTGGDLGLLHRLSGLRNIRDSDTLRTEAETGHVIPSIHGNEVVDRADAVLAQVEALRLFR